MHKRADYRRCVILCLVLPVVFISSCEDFQVKSYDINLQDAQACEMLQDTLLIQLTTASVDIYDPAWHNNMIPQIAGEFITALINNTVSVEASDSVFVLQTGDRDTSYCALAGTTAKQLTLYLDENLDLEIYSSSGDLLHPSNDIMPIETIGECTYVDENKNKPLIRTRLEYSTPDAEYLIRFIKIDQTEKSVIRLAVIAGVSN
jgi:hypothetical protein